MAGIGEGHHGRRLLPRRQLLSPKAIGEQVVVQKYPTQPVESTTCTGQNPQASEEYTILEVDSSNGSEDAGGARENLVISPFPEMATPMNHYKTNAITLTEAKKHSNLNLNRLKNSDLNLHTTTCDSSLYTSALDVITQCTSTTTTINGHQMP